MRTLFIIFSLFPGLVFAVVSPTAEQVAKDIEQQGAGVVISRLYQNNEREWQYVTDKIATGENRWLKVASLLAPGTDAGSSETLTTAVALAIPHNPAGVLGTLTEREMPLSIRQVCRLPFYMMSEPEFNQYVLDAIRALYKVPAGKACMDTMINTIGQSDGFNEDN